MQGLCFTSGIIPSAFSWLCQASLLPVHHVCIWISKLWGLTQTEGFVVVLHTSYFKKCSVMKGVCVCASLWRKEKCNNKNYDQLLLDLLCVPLNQGIASCSQLHSALLLLPLAGLQTETTSALNLLQRRGEVQPPEAFRMCLPLGFSKKMFADATAGEPNGEEKWCWMSSFTNLSSTQMNYDHWEICRWQNMDVI